MLFGNLHQMNYYSLRTQIDSILTFVNLILVELERFFCLDFQQYVTLSRRYFLFFDLDELR